MSVAAALLFLSAGSLLQAQSPSPDTSVSKQERNKTMHANGTFEVKMEPKAPDSEAAGAVPGRMLLDKQFHGALEATSKGQMLAFRTKIEGSAGYVAMEEVNGTLDGKRGTFVLQHSGTMNRGVPQMSVTVVPDSGTGELEGLSGQMAIKVETGKHFYDFDYALPGK